MTSPAKVILEKKNNVSSHISFTQFLPMVASCIIMIHCQNQKFNIRTNYVYVFLSFLIRCVDTTSINPISQMYLHPCPQQHCFVCVPHFLINRISVFIKFNAFSKFSLSLLQRHIGFLETVVQFQVFGDFLLSFPYGFLNGFHCAQTRNTLCIISICKNLLRFCDLRYHLSWFISGDAWKMCIRLLYKVIISRSINKKNNLTYLRISFISSPQPLLPN